MELNSLDNSLRRVALSKCCGSKTWVEKMLTIFPVHNSTELSEAAEKIWFSCNENDWRDAFEHHPRIGDIDSLKEKYPTTADWAEGEQAGVRKTSRNVLEDLSNANRNYEEKFGYIFIVCATGKTSEEMLTLLQSRLNNKPEDEIKIAMGEQNKITKIRLQKLLT